MGCRIPILDEKFDDSEEAYDYVVCVGNDFCDSLLDMVKERIVEQTPEEDRRNYRMAYEFILDALEYINTGIEVGDSAAVELLEAHIEESE